MTRFIIATNNASAPQKNAITQAITGMGWGLWHHFDDFWMVATNESSDLTPKSLFENLQQISAIKDMHMIIMRFPESSASNITFFGRGPASGWEWTKKHWVDVG